MTLFVHEIQFESAGYPGAPGYTNLYFELAAADSPTDAQFAAVHTFLTAIAGQEPLQWSGQIVPTGRVLLTDTGTMGSFTNAPVGAVDPVPGRAGNTYGAGVAGVVFGWQTLVVRLGRVIRGRTFLVPMSSVPFDADGTIRGDALIAFQQAADGLIAANVGFCIWSRPRLGVGGVTAPVTAMRMSDQSAFLSSRRR